MTTLLLLSALSGLAAAEPSCPAAEGQIAVRLSLEVERDGRTVLLSPSSGLREGETFRLVVTPSAPLFGALYARPEGERPVLLGPAEGKVWSSAPALTSALPPRDEPGLKLVGEGPDHMDLLLSDARLAGKPFRVSRVKSIGHAADAPDHSWACYPVPAVEPGWKYRIPLELKREQGES